MIKAAARGQGVDMESASAGERLDALVRHLETGGPLCPGTIGVYRQQSRIACERLAGDEGGEQEVARAILSARRALSVRAGCPDPARGPSRKLKDPTLEELGDVFSHLRWKFIESGDVLDLTLALYIAVMPRIGLRPVELTRARWDGDSLWVRTAKRPGRPERYVPSEHWPPVFKMALGVLIRLVPRDMDDQAFEGWRNVLAARLARASKWTRTRRRLSLYCARHIAIASWKQIGITPGLIARLAGHAGLRSQHYYADGRAGYGARYMFVTEAEAQAMLETAPAGELGGPSMADGIKDRRSASGTADSPAGREAANEGGQANVAGERVKQVSCWEEFPEPAPKRTDEPDKELWRKYSQQQDAELARLDIDLLRMHNEREAQERSENNKRIHDRGKPKI